MPWQLLKRVGRGGGGGGGVGMHALIMLRGTFPPCRLPASVSLYSSYKCPSPTPPQREDPGNNATPQCKLLLPPGYMNVYMSIDLLLETETK